MKPNLVIVQPPHITADEVIERFCEELCETHYVYLIRPSSEFRDDSPSGVRFLNHSIDHLPEFAKVDTAIAIGEEEIERGLREAYPTSSHLKWNPQDDSRFPQEFIASKKASSIVEGNFRRTENREIARAM